MATPRPKAFRQPKLPKPQQNPTTSAHPAPTQPLTLNLTQPKFLLQECIKQRTYALPLARSGPLQTKK